MRKPIEELVRGYQKSLFATAYSICRNAEDANDAVQETLIRYMTSEKQFKSEQHLRAWLTRVCINQSLDTVRSFWCQNRMPLEEEVLSDSMVVEGSDKELLEAVLNLPEKIRIVVHLFYYEDLTVREVARILKTTEGAVKMRLMRGRRMLKEALKEDWNDDE